MSDVSIKRLIRGQYSGYNKKRIREEKKRRDGGERKYNFKM